MNVLLLEEAERQYEAEDSWWREHRDAKSLFAEEFRNAVLHLMASPSSGRFYRRVKGKRIQRWMMKKTRCHVYYSHDKEKNQLVILSIWGARRSRGPRL